MKVSELQRHLKAYVEQDPKHKDIEVMLRYDGDVAFGVAGGDNHDAMGIGMNVERFLVLSPNFSGTKLSLNKSIN